MSVAWDCENCGAARGDPRTVRYTLDVENPDGSTGRLHFKIAKARAMIGADPRPPRRIKPAALRAFLDKHVEAVNLDHLNHIPEIAVREPGLVVQFDELGPDGEPVATAVLIDGTHRAARSLRDALPFFAYVLTDGEMAAIVEPEEVGYARVPGLSPDLSATPLGAVSQ